MTWEEVIDRNPKVVILADAEWSTAQEKIDYLTSDPAYSSIDAIQNARFIPIPFSDTSLGVCNINGVEVVAKGLYPAKFE